ncbi:sensor histidine kinase [Cryptosporangium aurantiacum]|uniref:Sensor-like histidine kinase SenX3 n=1 Tax=Cryptosporangium aurantiacum TaxID=134849 RepID=A0A1M7JFW6_9ACTN|nr:ATP-binding protein [Cryptosporangium aurantiacum]SHM51929.1 Signal transduction histidine kinase [Cryptosporangium aurantiacum]
MSVYPAVAGRHARLPHWASLPVVVGVVGLSVALLITGVLHQAEQRRAVALLDRQATEIEAAVTAESNRYVDTLTDLTAAIGAQTSLTPADFAAIMSGLSAERLYGASAVSLVMPSAGAELPDLAEEWNPDERADALVPDLLALPHRFVVLNRTLDGSAARIGRDAAAIAPAREAMDLAVQRGQPTASRTYVLSKDVELVPAAQRQLSFVVTAPVRSAGNAGDGELRGWLVMGLRGQDFLERTLRRAAAGQVQVELSDVDGSAVRRVAGWPRRQSSLVPEGGIAGRAEAAERIGITPSPSWRTAGVEHRWVEVAGRTWLLSVAPVDGYIQPDSTLDSVVLFAGTVIALLLAALVGVLTRSRDRALADVERATAALRADVARREEVELELRRRERELAGFAGVAAHDLRSPLTAASAYLEVLADDESDRLDTQGQEFLGRARSAVARTDRMLTDLLEYATAENKELNRAHVDLAVLAADVIAERTDRLEPDPYRVTLGELPVVSGDRGMLCQVLDNLIGNALKYTAPGRPPRVAVGSRRIEGGWRIEVADRGIGIPFVEREGVFDAFHRGDGSAGFSGSGLGLAICRRIVERHGGTIGIDDNPEGGSVFWFTLPDA